MDCEREILMREAVPVLQDFCGDFGLQFQLIDLNWGVREHDITNQDLLQSLKDKELHQCQKLSIGPNFIVRLSSFGVVVFALAVYDCINI